MKNKLQKPKVLYFMHVPWGWIKQRPHFLAEKLSQYFDLTVVDKRVIKFGASKQLPTQKVEGISFLSFNALPLYSPFKCSVIKLFDYINKLLLKAKISFNDYDYIWVPSLLYYYKIKDLIPKNAKLIYDCMDDDLAFPRRLDKKLMQSVETELLNKADLVFCSAENLKNVMLSRSGVQRVIHIVNNASTYPDMEASYLVNQRFVFDSNSISMVYIGTIATWFDFDNVVKLLDSKDSLHLYLIGPIDTEITIPNHHRIHVLGVCKHDEIWGIMKCADILIMPFQVTPLIESVNPVKLYEYIWSMKPIIATRYKESEKFSDYVYLYSSIDDLRSIIETIVDNKYLYNINNRESIKQFLTQNSWDNRMERVMEAMNRL
ncbi:hypothetical protein [Bacteroides sp.]|uniref:hypothetical protein n=1 Tax=Bacteroides sp. TaxID=29523 RepID=UPI002603426C|nr:hypothetical protein [Bacteroides sp.]